MLNNLHTALYIDIAMKQLIKKIKPIFLENFDIVTKIRIIDVEIKGAYTFEII